MAVLVALAGASSGRLEEVVFTNGASVLVVTFAGWSEVETVSFIAGVGVMMGSSVVVALTKGGSVVIVRFAGGSEVVIVSFAADDVVIIGSAEVVVMLGYGVLVIVSVGVAKHKPELQVCPSQHPVTENLVLLMNMVVAVHLDEAPAQVVGSSSSEVVVFEVIMGLAVLVVALLMT